MRYKSGKLKGELTTAQIRKLIRAHNKLVSINIPKGATRDDIIAIIKKNGYDVKHETNELRPVSKGKVKKLPVVSEKTIEKELPKPKTKEEKAVAKKARETKKKATEAELIKKGAVLQKLISTKKDKEKLLKTKQISNKKQTMKGKEEDLVEFYGKSGKTFKDPKPTEQPNKAPKKEAPKKAVPKKEAPKKAVAKKEAPKKGLKKCFNLNESDIKILKGILEGWWEFYTGGFAVKREFKNIQGLDEDDQKVAKERHRVMWSLLDMTSQNNCINVDKNDIKNINDIFEGWWDYYTGEYVNRKFTNIDGFDEDAQKVAKERHKVMWKILTKTKKEAPKKEAPKKVVPKKAVPKKEAPKKDKIITVFKDIITGMREEIQAVLSPQSEPDKDEIKRFKPRLKALKTIMDKLNKNIMTGWTPQQKVEIGKAIFVYLDRLLSGGEIENLAEDDPVRELEPQINIARELQKKYPE